MTIVAHWVVLLRGLLSEISFAQSVLNAHQIPTFVRGTDLHGITMELLVPSDQVKKAREVLSSTLATATEETDRDQGSDWDE